MTRCEDVLRFWFDETEPAQWWRADDDFDAQIRERFLLTLEQGAQGELHAWRDTPRGRLAEIIVLDQFSRNVFRNTPRAFAQDAWRWRSRRRPCVRRLTSRSPRWSARFC